MDESQERPLNLRSVWDILMSLVYLSSGIILYFFWQPESIPLTNRAIAALVLMIYALYRLRKTYLRTRKTGLQDHQE